MQIKDYLSRQNFLQYSNAKNILQENLFNITYMKNDGGIVISDSSSFSNIFNDILWNSPANFNIYDFLKTNTFAITLSDMVSTNTTQYMNDARRQIFHKREDKNFSISFVESADFSIRRVLDIWINMSMPESKTTYYRDDICVDIQVEGVDYNYNSDTKIVYSKCIPVSYENIELNLGNEASLKLVACEFVFRKQIIQGIEE